MVKIKNSLKLKKIIRIFLVSIIVIELIIIVLHLWDFFSQIVIRGLSTTSFKSENNYFVRLYSFFEIGVGTIIKEWVVNLCIPLLTYFLLRDRDREILYGEEQLHDVTEAVKEGIIEGVEETQKSNINSDNVKKTDNNEKNSDNFNDKEIKNDNKKDIEEKKNDDFFATFS